MIITNQHQIKRISLTDLDLKTKVALLEKDISQVTTFFEKLDSAIDKLCDVSASIKELLAVHDHKLSHQTEVNDEIYRLINDLKTQNHLEHVQTKTAILDLSARIDKLEKWKYTIVGGSIVIGFLLSFLFNLPLFT